ncbi:HutD family protein [Streptomyces sp. Da 82-17]|uniref:HutD/Ves family protein n=1 Tax=Streptomyces sp. Da 82-17 TaxID=3377116 RepID=UPI0038D415C8
MPAQHPTTARIIRTTTLTPQRWANGGGWTREIHREPATTPDRLPAWRLSLADIDEPGPFSSLPGMDRHFLLAAPRFAPLELVVDGVLHIVHFPRSIAFAGDAEVTTTAVPAGTRALNFMVRSGNPGSLQLLRGDTELTVAAETTNAMVLLDGDAYVDGERLGRFDAILPGSTGARLALRNATMARFPSHN